MAGSNATSSPLRIISHNTQGLNSPVKRRKAFQVYRARHIDVVLLQETHFPLRYTPSFLHAHFPVFYLANAENKTKGVAIIFSKQCKFNFKMEHKDPEGRFLLVKGTIDDKLYTFISYYAPNKGQTQFFRQLFKTLGPLMEGVIIMGGDSNTAFDTGLDKSNPLKAQSVRPSRAS